MVNIPINSKDDNVYDFDNLKVVGQVPFVLFSQSVPAKVDLKALGDDPDKNFAEEKKVSEVIGIPFPLTSASEPSIYMFFTKQIV